MNESLSVKSLPNEDDMPIKMGQRPKIKQKKKRTKLT